MPNFPLPFLPVALFSVAHFSVAQISVAQFSVAHFTIYQYDNTEILQKHNIWKQDKTHYNLWESQVQHNKYTKT